MTPEHRGPNVGEVVSAANQLRAFLGEIVGALFGHANTTMQRRRGGFDLDQCFFEISVQRFSAHLAFMLRRTPTGLRKTARRQKIFVTRTNYGTAAVNKKNGRNIHGNAART
jgi:hypothetical protein